MQEERRAKVEAILAKVGLAPEHAERYPHQFSGGQRQRVGIARALIMNPKLIIADECISALDVSIQAQVVNLMKDIQQETGTAYLFIAHDLSMVKYISDRIGVLHLGHLLETGTTEEIFENPIHPYTRSLLSAIPLPNPVVEKRRVAETYDYATSGIDYTQGTNHHVERQPLRQVHRRRVPQVDEITVPQKFTEPLPAQGLTVSPAGNFYMICKKQRRVRLDAALFFFRRQPM